MKITLVDDHSIVRDGIKLILNQDSKYEIVGEAASYSELQNILKSIIPDLILLDISLPDKSGIEIADILTKKYPSIKILMLSMYNDDEFIFNSLKAGANGFLPKNTNKKELLTAINTIYEGNDYLSEKVSDVIINGYLKRAHKESPRKQKNTEKLTKREEEVLKLFSQGNSNQEIADKLFISIRTVESHKNHIMQKLSLNSVVDLVKYAIKNQYVDFD